MASGYAERKPGLSPRVRGNPGTCRNPARQRGSIPARAGEPRCLRVLIPFSRVYPRACGGTITRTCTASVAWGLSPRVRGNRGIYARAKDDVRSIPARAGEPHHHRVDDQLRAVYPRACGGTAGDADHGVGVLGLSPRVRGNLVFRGVVGIAGGSIPARAGEPASPKGRKSPRTVYPRACGGTIYGICCVPCASGLSPRVRGNLDTPVDTPPSAGSIPARAGEPLYVTLSTATHGVYPRACGGTPFCRRGCAGSGGLSPRVRGNP